MKTAIIDHEKVMQKLEEAQRLRRTIERYERDLKKLESGNGPSLYVNGNEYHHILPTASSRTVGLILIDAMSLELEKMKNELHEIMTGGF